MSDQPPWPQIGAIISFLANVESVGLGLPECDVRKPVRLFVGTVVGIAPMVPHGSGKVPTAALRIRGRTGRQLTIDGAGCYAREHPSFADAEARQIPVFP